MNREEFRKEWNKLKKMSIKDRFWYLGAYYKVPILICLAMLFLLYQAVGAFLRSRQDCMLYCAFIGQSYGAEARIEELKKDFYAKENFRGQQILTFDASLSLTGGPEEKVYNDASAILFQSLLGTKTLDVVITGKDTLEKYHKENIFLNPRDALSAELVGLLEGAGALLYLEDAGGRLVPAGICLENSLLVSAYGLDRDSVLGICTLDNHPEVIESFVRFAFGTEFP